MKRRSILISTLIVSSLLLVAGISMAQRGRRANGPEGPGDRNGPDRMLAQLDLSSAQLAKIKPMKKAHREKMRKMRDGVEALHEQMRVAMEKSTPSRKEVIGIHRKIHKQRGAMMEERINFWFDVAEQLTSAQRQKLAKLRASHPRGRRGRHGGRHGECGGPGGGPGAMPF